MTEYQTKNYTAHGGQETVIGGKLTILPGAMVEGLEGVLSFPRASPQSDSTATTIAALLEDFNALLGKLRGAGLLTTEDGAVT